MKTSIFILFPIVIALVSCVRKEPVIIEEPEEPSYDITLRVNDPINLSYRRGNIGYNFGEPKDSVIQSAHPTNTFRKVKPGSYWFTFFGCERDTPRFLFSWLLLLIAYKY